MLTRIGPNVLGTGWVRVPPGITRAVRSFCGVHGILRATALLRVGRHTLEALRDEGGRVQPAVIVRVTARLAELAQTEAGAA